MPPTPPPGTAFRWIKQPDEIGLAKIRQAPRGYDLAWGEWVDLAHVRPVHGPYRVAWGGWMWYTNGVEELAIPERPMSQSSLFEKIEDARREARLYVKSILAAQGYFDPKRVTQSWKRKKVSK